MLRLMVFFVALAAVTPAAAQYRDRSVQMGVVANLDIDRYAGLWYEIARFPNRFERGCVGVTARYGILSDGRIKVTNTCIEGHLGGPVRSIEGTARIEGPGRLSVNFVPWLPFARGAYWVLDVTPDYGVAVVGNPAGNTGWILARSPVITSDLRSRALKVLVRNGYDIARIEWVPQQEK